MGNGSADFANNVRHFTPTKFLHYFTSLNNHKIPSSLLLLVLRNSNEIMNKMKSNLHYTRLIPFMGVASLRGLFPIASTTGTQFNVAIAAGRCKLVLDMIDAVS